MNSTSQVRAARRLLAKRLVLALAAACAVFPVTARCGAPFATDDPVTVAAGHVELLLLYQSTLSETGRTGSLPGLEAHFGALDGLELDVVAPLAFSTAGGETRHGYGDTTLGLKYRLAAESDALPLVSVVPRFVARTGNSDRGLGNGGSQIFLAASAQKTYGRFLTYGNAGYWINNGAGNRNYWFLGWQAQYDFDPHWTLGAEIFHTTGQVVGLGDSTGFNVGGYCNVDQHNHVLFSAGKGLQNAAQTNRVSTYVAYQRTF